MSVSGMWRSVFDMCGLWCSVCNVFDVCVSVLCVVVGVMCSMCVCGVVCVMCLMCVYFVVKCV